MKLGLQLGYWGAQPNPFSIALAQEAERLEFDSVWTAEAWGSDAFTPAAWSGAHARSPLERPLHARARCVRPTGRRGLVRPAVRQATRPHARVRRDRPAHPAA